MDGSAHLPPETTSNNRTAAHFPPFLSSHRNVQQGGGEMSQNPAEKAEPRLRLCFVADDHAILPPQAVPELSFHFT